MILPILNLGGVFFQSDQWRFPIGKNPKYGLEVSNSIIFTDSIPIFAFIFKIFKNFLYDEFQYFGFWIFLSIFLQGIISFFLIYKITNNNFFSILSAFLFLLCPFFLFRLSHHFSLGAHWLILYSLYISFLIPDSKKNLHWIFLTLLSVLIHLYFTLMLLIIYSCYQLEKFIQTKKFSNLLLNLSIMFILTFGLMYIAGYFESSPINAVSTGYGYKKLDLLGFFDPKISDNQSWSIIFPDLFDSSLEGFNYLGAGNLSLILIAISILIKKINR